MIFKFIISGLLDMKDLERPFANINSETNALASTEFVLDSVPVIQLSSSHWRVWSVCGEDFRLSCSISSLGYRTVSWVRYRDIHLLTAGKDSYTDDKRFSAHHPIMTNTWQLRIKMWLIGRIIYHIIPLWLTHGNWW